MDISKFEKIIENFYKNISSVDDQIASIKLSEDKWMLKEMIGHLVDSTSNNHQRFIRLKENKTLEFPQYDQEFWIKAADYS